MATKGKAMELTLQFGALAPKLETQLRARGIRVRDRSALRHLQTDADAITWLYIRCLVDMGTVGEARAVDEPDSGDGAEGGREMTFTLHHPIGVAIPTDGTSLLHIYRTRPGAIVENASADLAIAATVYGRSIREARGLAIQIVGLPELMNAAAEVHRGAEATPEQFERLRQAILACEGPR